MIQREWKRMNLPIAPGTGKKFHLVPGLKEPNLISLAALNGGWCRDAQCLHYKGHDGLHRTIGTNEPEKEWAYPWPESYQEAVKMRLNNQMTVAEFALWEKEHGVV